MTKDAKIVSAIIAVIVIGGIVWAAVMRKNGSVVSNTAYQTPTAQNETPVTSPTNNQAPAAQAVDSSDTSIDGDMTSIDAQMNGLNSDSSGVDQSMNEQQAPQ